MLDKLPTNVGWLREDLKRVRKEEEVRYVPIPHPEDVRAWLRAAYEAGRQDGAQDAPPEVIP